MASERTFLTADGRQYVRPLRQHRHPRAGSGAAERACDSFGGRSDGFDEERTLDLQREPVAVEQDVGPPERLAQALRHPLVDGEERRIAEPRLQAVCAPALAKARLERGAADALAEARAQQDRTARPHDGRSGGDPLDRLVERRVEGSSPAGDDHDVGGLLEGGVGLGLDEADRRRVGVFDVAAEDSRDPPVAVESHLYAEVDADPAHDFDQRFVERVAVEDARAYVAFEHRRAVGDPDRLGGGEAGADGLPSPGVAGHEVRFDEARHDPQIALCEEAIDLDRHPSPCATEVDVGGGIPCVVLDDPERARELGAEDLAQLFGSGQPVEPGRDLDGHRAPRQPTRAQRIEERRKDDRVRYWPRPVAHDDDRIAAASGEISQRQRPERRVDAGTQRARRVGEGKDSGLPQHVDAGRSIRRRLGQLDLELPIRVGDADPHGREYPDTQPGCQDGIRGGERVPFRQEGAPVRGKLASVSLAAVMVCVAFAAAAADAPGAPATAASPEGGRFATVIIDPGHGGDDHGAAGPEGLLEKAVVLDVAIRLADRLRAQGLRTVLTREHDIAVALQERTRIANDSSGDLFVSIHANAAPSRAARGTETYFLSLEASDEASGRVAARENEAFGTGVSAPGAEADPVSDILGDLASTEHLMDSDEFSRLVDGRLAAIDPVPSRGVKQAPFAVLMGVRMPAVLVEIGFITNPKEARRLADPASQDGLADAISAAVVDFARRYDARRGAGGEETSRSAAPAVDATRARPEEGGS